MSSLVSILKLIGGPGSLTLLALCILAAIALAWWKPRARRAARIFLVLVGVVYLVLALPVVAHGIADRLPSVPPANDSVLRNTRMLIVFDGDNRRGRVAEAQRVYRLAHPATVLMLGEKWMTDALLEAGIPSERLVSDSRAKTTLDQIGTIQNALGDKRDIVAAVIASRLQMPRIAALARAVELNVVLVPSPADTEPARSGLWSFVPTYYALRISRDAIYEHAALAYYRRHGWIE